MFSNWHIVLFKSEIGLGTRILHMKNNFILHVPVENNLGRLCLNLSLIIFLRMEKFLLKISNEIDFHANFPVYTITYIFLGTHFKF